jgi:HEAT repeat protein
MNDIASLVKQLTQPVTEGNEAAFEAAAIALGEQGEAALPAIKKLAAVDDIDQRFWAVRGLWANGGETAQAMLIDLLADEAEMIRSGAALALGELKAEMAIPALARLMREDPSASGDHAADALGKLGRPAAPALIAALKDERARVRIRATKALIPVESHAAIPDLIHCLDHDPSYLVRHYADMALTRMGVGEMVYFRPGG